MIKIQHITMALILLTSCHQKKATKSTSEATPLKTSGTASTIKEVIIDNTTDLTNIGSNYTIDSSSLAGDVMSVFVSYSGGCKEHAWEMYSNGMFEKSLPPKVAVILKHTNNSDVCRELINQEIRFNVTKLKNPSTKQIKIIVGDREVMYAYK